LLCSSTGAAWPNSSSPVPKPGRRSFPREYLHHACLSPLCRIGQISCHRRLYPLLCHRGRWDFRTGTPNLEDRTRSSIAVARAYNGAELGDAAWEHESPSSFREATTRSSQLWRGISVLNVHHSN
jgi:hypothetical protein